MHYEQDEATLIELGTASSDTHGRLIGAVPEDTNFYNLGLSDE